VANSLKQTDAIIAALIEPASAGQGPTEYYLTCGGVPCMCLPLLHQQTTQLLLPLLQLLFKGAPCCTCCQGLEQQAVHH
jgi:hypothetical protein